MALAIDPDSPHVTVLREAIEHGLCLDVPLAQVIGHLALLNRCIDHPHWDSSIDIQLMAERILWPWNDEFLIRVLSGTGWIRVVDGVYVRGCAWDFASVKDWE